MIDERNADIAVGRTLPVEQTEAEEIDEAVVDASLANLDLLRRVQRILDRPGAAVAERGDQIPESNPGNAGNGFEHIAPPREIAG